MSHRAPFFIGVLAAITALSAGCERTPAAQPAPVAPQGVQRWRIEDPREFVREGAIVASPPEGSAELVPSVPAMLRRAANECRSEAPAHGESRVEVQFGIARDGRASNAQGTIGGPLAQCIATHIVSDSHELQRRVAPVQIVARLVLGASP